MKALVVDDARYMRTLLTDILQKMNITVAGEASNGIEAIKQYNIIQPDLVFMDITMKDMNGLEALKGIRAIDPKAKVIMCSAMGQQSFVIEAIKSGAIDFIVKPFGPERVEEAINKAIVSQVA